MYIISYPFWFDLCTTSGILGRYIISSLLNWMCYPQVVIIRVYSKLYILNDIFLNINQRSFCVLQTVDCHVWLQSACWMLWRLIWSSFRHMIFSKFIGIVFQFFRLYFSICYVLYVKCYTLYLFGGFFVFDVLLLLK